MFSGIAVVWAKRVRGLFKPTRHDGLLKGYAYPLVALLIAAIVFWLAVQWLIRLALSVF